MTAFEVGDRVRYVGESPHAHSEYGTVVQVRHSRFEYRFEVRFRGGFVLPCAPDELEHAKDHES